MRAQAPYFDSSLYEAEVNEDEDNLHVLITVTAKDKDESSKLRYEIVKGNIGGGAFAVNNETGAIYVAGPLDYELRKEVSNENNSAKYSNRLFRRYEMQSLFSLILTLLKNSTL